MSFPFWMAALTSLVMGALVFTLAPVETRAQLVFVILLTIGAIGTYDIHARGGRG